MVLVYIDQADQQIKKSSLEAMSYGAALAKQLGCDVTALILGTVQNNLADLGKHGAQKVYHLKNESLNSLDVKLHSTLIATAAKNANATVVVFAHNINGKAIAPAVAVKLEAGIVTGASSLPNTENGFVVTKTVFSGKAFASIQIETAIKVIAINQNSFGLVDYDTSATIEEINISVPAPSIKITKVDKIEGEIPLTEANLVVSGGRGLKGPEHWNILLDLAKALGASTACSRPVSDSDWRPHHEHVGQTGIQIAPNLYIAIGISGAIQHLAGVNRSKTIVVINKDPEAPFFKAADYGVVGDAFEVVPALTSAILKMKSTA
ncbi:MAG: electron transfer flavoprotein subunit alpha/FixB family protein [Sediminibacterium sp.]|nr:MAG: electron transfer flavoprotein subunit alpha/FixB family protein [Sediminibacterium sp.]